MKTCLNKKWMKHTTLILAFSSLAVDANTALGDSDADILAEVQAVREEAAEQQWSFTTADFEQVKRVRNYQRGLIVPREWREQANFDGDHGAAVTTEELPERWDWRERGGVTPVKDQGVCGSCWAFGTLAAFESAVFIATGRSLNMSEQQLLSCSSYGSCSGGYYAFGYFLSNGVNYAKDFPYSATNGSCRRTVAQNEKLANWSYVGNRNGEPTTQEIKSAIYNYGVVAATVYAAGAWDYYKSGVYNACTYGAVNHMVAIVGWDDADQAWIVKNSWGTSYGEKGYIKMRYTDSRGRKCNNIGETAAYAVFNPTELK